jgi:hypothetical protein
VDGVTARSVPWEVEPGYPDEGPNVMRDPDDIARFYDCCSDFMRELLEALAGFPDEPRPFPEVEDAMGWPRRRIASVLGGVCRLRHREFGGRRPYHFLAPRVAASGRWEIWADAGQASAIRSAELDDDSVEGVTLRAGARRYGRAPRGLRARASRAAGSRRRRSGG